MTENDPRPIALVGLLGSGKSAVGRALARRAGLTCVDLDDAVVAAAGLTIAELYAREGEAGFRDREEAELERAIAAGAGVIACGGGVVLRAGNRARLAERCRTVWLEVRPEEAARRVLAQSGGRPDEARPVLRGAEVRVRLDELLAERASRYTEVARWRIPTDSRAPEDVAEEILRFFDTSNPDPAPPRS